MTPRIATRVLVGSFLAVQAAQLILLLLFEKSDYDTFTFYFPKVELMRWWTVADQPLTSYIQEFLPIGYTNLQMKFGGSASRNFMNYAVVVTCAFILIRARPRLFVPFAFFALANTGFFMQASGYKNDGPLAALSVILLLAVSYDYFRFQITALAALVALMLSVKWSSLPVIGTAGLLYLPVFVRSIREQRKGLGLDLVAAVLVAAALYHILYLDDYRRAYIATGSFSPTQTFGIGALAFNPSYLLVGLPQYMLVSAVETFEPLWASLTAYPSLGPFLRTATLGAKDHVLIVIGQHFHALNIFDGAGLGASVFVLTRFRATEPFVRNCAIAALASTVVILAFYPYQPYHANRYFMSGQLLSYVPLAAIVLAAWERSSPRRQAASLVALAVAHLIICGRMLVIDQSRNLIPVSGSAAVSVADIEAGTIPQTFVLPPIYNLSETQRTFRSWLGFASIYEVMGRTLTVATPLQIVFHSREHHSDYTYPFLRERHPANTYLSDIAQKPFAGTAPYVLCFSPLGCRAVAESGGYDKLSDQGPTIALWRKMP